MHTFQISSQTSGVILGVYAGADERSVIEALGRDAGYATLEEQVDVLGKSVDDMIADLFVVKMDREFHRKAVAMAENLEELRDALNAAEGFARNSGMRMPGGIVLVVDLDTLPKFGKPGEDPVEGYLSWDEDHYLVRRNREWLIFDRQD